MKKKITIKSIEEVRGHEVREVDAEAARAIDSWVSETRNREVSSKNNLSINKRLSVDLPEEIFRAFKADCVEKGLKIKERIVSLIEKEIASKR